MGLTVSICISLSHLLVTTCLFLRCSSLVSPLRTKEHVGPVRSPKPVRLGSPVKTSRSLPFLTRGLKGSIFSNMESSSSFHLFKGLPCDQSLGRTEDGVLGYPRLKNSYETSNTCFDS